MLMELADCLSALSFLKKFWKLCCSRLGVLQRVYFSPLKLLLAKWPKLLLKVCWLLEFISISPGVVCMSPSWLRSTFLLTCGVKTGGFSCLALRLRARMGLQLLEGVCVW
jgi:hypothetical protein